MKPGDLVKISDKIDQKGIPPSRMGIVVQRIETIIDYTDIVKQPTDVYLVQLMNGEIMRFHEMWLEIVRSA
jgi:hypothetical protein